MNRLFKFSVLLSFVFVLNACNESNNEPQPSEEDNPKVMILNEGGFLKGNASFDLYDKTEEALSEDVFFALNNRPLGDVLQSVVLSADKLYWVVNNSGKIEVTDKQGRSQASITGFTSPRYMAVMNGKGYVSDLFSGKIWVTDLMANKITDSILAPGWSEGIVATEGEVWVARPSFKSIYRIDISGNVLKDSIELSSGASELIADGKGNIWALCGGNSSNNVKASITQIRLSDRKILSEIFFDGQYPSRLRYHQGNVYFVVSGDVYRVAENASEAGIAWLSGVAAYGLEIDPQNGEVWIGNAKDFTGKSEVTVYSQQGDKLKTLQTGVATNGFLFLP